MKPRIPPKSAIAPAPYEPADIYAVQALARGDANEHQQRRALDWILDAVCRVNDLPYRPGSFDETSFASGRQFCGQQIIKAMKLSPDVFDRGGPAREIG